MSVRSASDILFIIFCSTSSCPFFPPPSCRIVLFPTGTLISSLITVSACAGFTKKCIPNDCVLSIVLKQNNERIVNKKSLLFKMLLHGFKIVNNLGGVLFVKVFHSSVVKFIFPKPAKAFVGATSPSLLS